MGGLFSHHVTHAYLDFNQENKEIYLRDSHKVLEKTHLNLFKSIPSKIENPAREIFQYEITFIQSFLTVIL